MLQFKLKRIYATMKDDDGVKQPPKNAEPVIVQDVIPATPASVDVQSGKPGTQTPAEAVAAETSEEPVVTQAPVNPAQGNSTDKSDASEPPATQTETTRDPDEIVPGEAKKAVPAQPEAAQASQKPAKSGNGVTLVITFAIIAFLALATVAVYSQIK